MMKNRRNLANWIFTAIVIVLFLCCFLTQQVYAATTKYASLAAFVALAVLFITYENPFELIRRKDAEFLSMCAVDVLALVFLLMVHSHLGAILTVVNLGMVLFLCKRVAFSRKQLFCITFSGSVLLLPWFGLVKWDYNYNMVGLVIMTLTILAELFLEMVRKDYDRWYLSAVQLLLYATGALFTVLYHSRCAIAGFLAGGLLYAAMKLFCRNKILYGILTGAATLGSILFTLLYVLLGRLDMNLVILYKSVLSGREDIWGELWEAFLHQPVTGIGSAYTMKSFFIFEVHNGLFDILVVHGAFVFAVLFWLLIRRLSGVRKAAIEDREVRIALAGIYAVLFTSFFENYFIVSPYLLVFFVLFTIVSSAVDVTCTNG